MRRPGWRRILGALLILLAAGYLARAIALDWQELRAFPWRADPGRLATSLVAQVLVLFWGVGVLGRVLTHLGPARVAPGTLLRIWFVSNLARYVPGKLFQFVAVYGLSRSAGLAPAVVLTGVLVHAGMSLLAAALLASWTLGPLLAGGAPAVGLTVGAVALVSVHPRLLNALLVPLPRLLGRPTVRWTGSWLDGVLLLALSLASWIFYGGAYQLFVSAFTEAPWTLFPELAGVNALSFVIGYASLLPGGLGVRELAMAELLRPLFPGAVAAVLALSTRLWTVAGELVGCAIVFRMGRSGPEPAAGSDPVSQGPPAPR